MGKAPESNCLLFDLYAVVIVLMSHGALGIEQFLKVIRQASINLTEISNGVHYFKYYSSID